MKIQTVEQAKANVSAAQENYDTLLAMQKKLEVAVPEALAQLHAAKNVALRVAAQQGKHERREAEINHLKQQIKAAKAGAPVTVGTVQQEQSVGLEELLNQVAGA
jgi:multidrug resistance efflux pump